MAIQKLTIAALSGSSGAAANSAATLTVDEYNNIQSNISWILGTGEGNYGYGQTLLTDENAPLAPNTSLTNTLYNLLADDIKKARIHQTGLASAAIIPGLAGSQAISLGYVRQLVSAVNLAETDRLRTPPSPANATNTEIARQQLTSEWNGTTTHTFQVNFGTAEDMRFYFNTGSEIQLLASRTTVGAIPKSSSAAKNTSWTSLLKGLGTLSFTRTATKSTSKIGNTSFGYASLFDVNGPLLEKKEVFRKYSTDNAFLLNYYSISAKIVNVDEETDCAIEFTIEFVDAANATLELNVSGTLVSIAKSYRATGINVAVPLPTIVTDSNVIEAGQAAPGYSITRSATIMREDGITGVDFEIVTTNVDDDTQVYWSIIGAGVTFADFLDADGIELDSIVNIPITITNNTSGPITLKASADLSTKEGTEKFNFIVRTDAVPSATNKVAELLTTAYEVIQDTSIASPPPPAPSVYFKTQTTSKYKEGATALFSIGALNAKTPLKVRWVAVSDGGTDISAADFTDGADTGTFSISSASTYILKRALKPKDGQEGTEFFRIELYITVNGIEELSDTSDTIEITDDYVNVPIVPPSVSTSGITSLSENSPTAGVEFSLSVPALADSTKVYWRIVQDSVGEITSADFSSTYSVGGAGIGGTSNDFITVKSKAAALKRYARNDGVTEGTESFKVEFYKAYPLTPENWIVTSPSVSITETVGYTISSVPTSQVVEGSTTGIRYTVTTPYTPTDTLFWNISTTSLITSSDFEALGASFNITNSTGYFDVYPRDEGITEGNQTFRVDIRTAAGGAGAVLISSPGETITELPVYTITTSITTVTEGINSVTYTITTPYTVSGTVYWSISSVTNGISTVTAADFLQQSTAIPINDSVGTLTLTPIADNSTEGDEEFRIVLRSSSSTGAIVHTQTDTLLIKELVDYTIKLSNNASTMGEGSSTTVRFVTPWMANNTPMFWRIRPVQGNITSADFSVVDADTTSGTTNRLYGTVRTQLITTGTQTVSVASFTLTAINDALTEGTETFQIELRLSENTDPIKVSDIYSVTELVPFRILLPQVNGIDVTNVNEGDSMTLTVRTPKRTKGTSLYWKAVSAGMGSQNFNYTSTLSTMSELTQMYGIIHVDDNNSSEILLTANADNLTEGNMNFYIELREFPDLLESELNDYVASESYLSLNGPFAARTLVPIMINDTSGTPEPVEVPPAMVKSVVPNHNSVIEGQSVTFSLTTENVPTTQPIYWRILSTSVNENEIAEGFAGGPVYVNSQGHLDITITTVANVRTGTKAFLLDIRLDDNSLATQSAAKSSAVEITKAQPYSIVADKLSVVEGGTVRFDVTTPLSVAPTVIHYTIVGTGVTAPDFGSGSLTGDITIGSTGTGYFTLTPVSTDSTEGDEQFTITLRDSANALITPISPCPTITITENVGYNIAASTLEIYENPVSGGQSSNVVFTVTTPAMSVSSTSLKYQIVSEDGTVVYTDFVEHKDSAGSPITGSFTVTKNVVSGKFTGTFTLTANPDNLPEGNADKFSIKLFTSDNIPIQLAASSPIITIKEVGTWSISLINPITGVAGSQSIVKDTRSTFYVSTPFLAANTSIYWEVLESGSSATVTVADFKETASANKLTGVEKVKDNKFSVSLTPTHLADLKSYTIQISEVSESAGFKTDVVAPTIRVTQNQTFSVIVPNTPLVEGNTVTFTVTYPGIPNNTFYWQLVETTGGVDASDFNPSLPELTGTKTGLTTTGGTTTVALTLATDLISEAAKSFKLAVSLTDGGPTVTGGLSNAVTFNDIGVATLNSDKASILPNEIVKYTLKLPATSTVGTIFWQINDSALSGYFTATTGTVISTTKSFDINVSSKTTYTTPLTTDTPFTITIKETNQSGTTINVTSPQVVLSAGYKMTPAGGPVNKTTGVSIAVTSPKSVTTIWWRIEGISSNVNANWFQSGAISGSITDVNSGYQLPVLIPTDPAGLGKKFKVIISEAANGKMEVGYDFTTPAVPVISPVVPNVVITSVKEPTGIIIGAPATDFVVSVSPSVATINFAIEGNGDGIMVNNSSTRSGGLSTTLTPTYVTAAANTGYAKLSISANTTAKSNNKFKVTYTATGVNGTQVTKSTSDITVSKTMITRRFYKSGELLLSSDNPTVAVTMVGGGGGGGGMAVAFGGNGGAGDKISGIVTIPSGASKLRFKLIKGGKASSTINSQVGLGGNGGDAFELFADDTYIATVAGGGGGAGGGPIPVPSRTTPTVEATVVGGAANNSLTTRYKTDGASAVDPAGNPTITPGTGAGGAPSGMYGISRTVSGKVYGGAGSGGYSYIDPGFPELTRYYAAGGVGGRGVASTTVDTGGTPYLGGVEGVPLTQSGEIGGEAYIEFTVLPMSNEVSFGYLEYKSGTNTTVNNTFTVPEGVTSLYVLVIGGGGGGGAGWDTGDYNGAAGGGGGAGRLIGVDVPVQAGWTATINVGGGGIAGFGAKGDTVLQAAYRTGGSGVRSQVVIKNGATTVSTIFAGAGNGGKGFNDTGGSASGNDYITTGGSAGSAYLTGPGTTRVTSPLIPGQTGLRDAYIDLLTGKLVNHAYTPGGQGANNGSIYGQGGNGGITSEDNVVNSGKPGTAGFVSITW